jgi:hypothetical protein
MPRIAVISFIAACSLASAAEAHFLFIRIGDHAEAGRGVEVYFSERADAGDPKFVEKIAHTKLWAQSEPGKFQPVEVHKLSDRLRGTVPVNGPVSIVGNCEYGVLSRNVPFLLRHYPKAIAGDPAKLAALEPKKEIPLEIVAAMKDGGLEFTLLQNGKPVPEAKFTTVDVNLTNVELKADAEGKATWRPESRGEYCVYASATTPKSGELDGKAYREIREFATIAFRWPLVRTDADEEAVAMFEKALAARAAWTGFPGFSAKVAGRVDGVSFSGSLKVDAEGKVALDVAEPAAKAWVEDQLGSIVLHRQASPAKKERPVLWFADDDTAHPLGRLLTFSGGQFASSYRVKDEALTVVNRNLGRRNMTITVLENAQNAEGKQLPRTYTVQYWDAGTGKLQQTESFRLAWARHGAFDLPETLSVTTASEKGLIVREVRLTDIELK